jgi:hypothetical protein
MILGKVKWYWGLLAVVVIGVTSVSVSLAATAPPEISALRTSNPPRRLPAKIDLALRVMAPEAGVSVAQARAATRLLLPGLNRSPIYAFPGRGGRVCFFVWPPGEGRCGAFSAAEKTMWVVGSWPHSRRAVFGIAVDGVRSVVVSIRGKVARVSVAHNAFLVPFTAGNWVRVPPPSVVPIGG